MSEMQTTKDLQEAIIRERGGESCFNAVQLRLTYALASALANPRQVDPGAVTKLLEQLPPLAGDAAPVHSDLSLLTDTELDALELLMTKCRRPGAAPALVGDVEALRGEIAALREECRLERERAANARFDCERRDELLAEARSEAARLREQLAKVAAAAAVTPSAAAVEPAPDRSNVVPIKGNGSLVTDVPLASRYPMVDGLNKL